MEDLLHFRTHHESRRRLALACAKALEGLEGFSGVRSAYKLYLQVPVRFIGQNADPNELGSVDLLICRARDGLAALAVVFDIGRDRVLIPNRLSGMNVRHLTLVMEPNEAKLEEAAGIIRRAAAELPADAGKVSGHVTMETFPLKRALSQWQIEMPHSDTLVRGQILYPDGAVTPYGADCGLVVRRVRRKSGWTDTLDVLVSRYGEARKALDYSRELRQPSRVCLQERVSAVSGGVPSDKAYPAHMAALLDKLLAAPVEDVIPPGGVMSHIRELFPDDPDCCATYGSALHTAHELLRRFLEGNGKDLALYDLADELLASLLNWLRKGPMFPPENKAEQQSIRLRVANIHGVPAREQIVSAPLFGYLQGASARLGTEYPCSLFRSWAGKPGYTVGSVAKWVRESRDKDSGQFDIDNPTYIPDAFFYMYSLLVEPICPDVDLWRCIETPY